MGQRGRVLVTGGAGYIGSHLARLLVERGQRVRVMERADAGTDHLPPDVEVVRADVREPAAVSEAVRGCDTVYHLAANANLWSPDGAAFEEVNHRGTRHVLDAAADHGVRRFVHASTETVLVPGAAAGAIASDARPRETDQLGPYCRSKLRAEEAVFEAARRGLPAVVVSPGVPVGPGDHLDLPILRLIRTYLDGGIKGYTRGRMNLVRVQDVAEAFARAAQRGEPGRRYLVGGEPWTIQDFFACLGELSGVPAPTFEVPYVVALTFAFLEEVYCRWLRDAPPLATVAGVRLARHTRPLDDTRSLQDLQLTLGPVRPALEATVQQLRGEPSSEAPRQALART